MSEASRSIASGIFDSVAKLGGRVASAAKITDYLISRRSDAAVIIFHGVSHAPPNFLESIYVTPSNFSEQIRVLNESTEVVPLLDLVAGLESGKKFERFTTAITFDDGLKHLLGTAVPVLKKYDVPATFFAVTGNTSTGNPIWTSRLAAIFAGLPLGMNQIVNLGSGRLHLMVGNESERLESFRVFSQAGKSSDRHTRDLLMREIEIIAKEASLSGDDAGSTDTSTMSWDDLRSLANSGFEIGSHTASHPILSRCSDDEIVSELESSREMLANNGVPDNGILAYPNGQPGDFDDRCARIAKGVGYKAALTTVAGHAIPGNNMYQIPRIGVSPRDSVNTFKLRLAGVDPSLARLR
jgi:peptidoglycan/xylan/chitin deacetylase (PgdA/CDA1 family)